MMNTLILDLLSLNVFPFVRNIGMDSNRISIFGQDLQDFTGFIFHSYFSGESKNT